MKTLLLIDDPPAPGSWNMAFDQALLEHVDEIGVNVLRFYRWSPATLSLGYFQHYDERAYHASSQSLDTVRRASGGGAIVHDQELTYSLVVPISSRWAQSNRRLYDIVHQAVLEQLGQQGITAQLHDDEKGVRGRENPLLCFQRRADGDILIDGHKIGGSAQRRGRNALLQHGSILLQQSEYAPELPGIFELTGVAIDDQVLSRKMAESISRDMGLNIENFAFNLELRERAREIEENRFLADSWTKNR